ncbi:MAG: hypothetical protein FWE08_06040 [Oscillospiraceae bacterium]|nr:hypothetical protein [Oscillospiraceae bacterium]
MGKVKTDVNTTELERGDILMDESTPEGVCTATGTCRFCGQLVEVGLQPGTVAADAAASIKCDCYKAKAERKILAQVESAGDRVNALFGAEAADLEFRPLTERKPIALLHQIVEYVARGHISSAVLQIHGTCKAKVSVTSKGKIKVERSETKTHGLESAG